MNVMKVYLTNGEIHNYPGDTFEFIGISPTGNLEISESQDDKGNMVGLIAGYPVGSWLYYRIFELRGFSSE